MLTTNAKILGVSVVGLVISGLLSVNQYKLQQQVNTQKPVTVVKETVMVQPTQPVASPTATLKTVKTTVLVKPTAAPVTVPPTLIKK